MSKIAKKRKRLNIISNVYAFLVYALLYIPVAVMMVFSFNDQKYNYYWNGFTTQWYAKLFPVFFLPVKRQVHKDLLVHDFRNHIRGCRAVFQKCRRCAGCKDGGIAFLFTCRTLQFLLIILDPADLCRDDMELLADK